MRKKWLQCKWINSAPDQKNQLLKGLKEESLLRAT